ncbi:M13 family metallopeptidase [Corallococcus silvisoli]|uniref:M13 family metallopeptidase n=1 Tax=Corallococcus silvisoli TaxID=2697031 RepID=UPI00137874AA|nr:M13 family metallopeptidase [Corallococcus silvisoli]NBD08501.1 M13 family peptidase [Corallococcus silvisoli]
MQRSLFGAGLCGLLALCPGTPADAGDSVELSRFMSNLADPTLDPCTDFYQYACARWLGQNPIPADQGFWTTTSNLKLWNQTVLRETLEHASRLEPSPSPAMRQIGDYWTACMDEAGVERAGLGALAADLRRIDGLRSKAALAAEVARLHLSAPNSTGGFNKNDTGTPAALFGFGPTQDFADSTLLVAAIDQGGLGLPGRDYYVSEDPRLQEQRARYREHVREMFILAGASPEGAARDADAVLGIETALARASMDAVARRDPKKLDNVRTLVQVRAATPSFNWAAYLKAVGAPAARHYIVATPGFLDAVERLIQRESLSHWKAYLRWWALHGRAEALPKAFVDENFSFYGRVLSGARELRPRWRRCVAYADRDLGEALGQAYVSRALPRSSKEQVEAMVETIEQTLDAQLGRLDWMTPETRAAARAKLRTLENKVGYPARFRDSSQIKVSRTDFLGNVAQATGFEVRRQLAKIGRPVDRAEWSQTPPTINAYCDAQLNSVNFSAGILQPPLFDPSLDLSVNYGAIGVVIGHEVIHGFDDQGRKFDGLGNLRDWWTAEDARRYDERVDCIARQYTRELPWLGIKTNGRFTLGEDTADNGGVHIAFLALQSALRKEGRSLDDVGADGLTARQRFFLSFAFSWCSADRPEAARRHVLTNPHSLPRFRVNNSLANFPAFQESFACKAGSPMSRGADACQVW